MNRYLFRFSALLAILLNIAYGKPALAENDRNSLPAIVSMKFDLLSMSTQWRDQQPFPNEAFLFFKEPGKGTDDLNGKGYRWEGPPAENPDWRGIKRDTAYFFAYQFAAIVILYISPESLSGWSQEDKENYSLSKWTENVRNPIWDDDRWWVNYVLHPYWGATYYIRARERGFKRMQSFWYSVLLSTLYEYGVEALFEPVSYQDLFVTPVAGALLGEYVFSPIRERIRAKERLGWTDKSVLFLTDPLGVVNAVMDRLLGVNTEVNFSSLKINMIPRSSRVLGEEEIIRPVRCHSKPLWGIQLNIRW